MPIRYQQQYDNLSFLIFSRQINIIINIQESSME